MCLRNRRRRYHDASHIQLDDARPVVYTALFDDSVGQASVIGSRRTRICRPLVVQAQPGQRIVVTLRRSGSPTGEIMGCGHCCSCRDGRFLVRRVGGQVMSGTDVFEISEQTDLEVCQKSYKSMRTIKVISRFGTPCICAITQLI